MGMIIFVIVGMPASGKDMARVYAESKKIPYFASGDIVRMEVKKRGLDPNPENTSIVSTELRGNDGMGVTRQVLASALESGSDVAFMEGMRSWPEIELIRKEVKCVVVAFLAPRHVRLNRIIYRGRSDDSPDAFKERDMREIAYGTSVPIALSDEYILNTGSTKNAINALGNIVKKYADKNH
jgi:dephospho-CoA kinase